MNYTVKQMKELISEVAEAYAYLAKAAEDLENGKIADDIAIEIEEVLSYIADIVENDQECWPSEILDAVKDIQELKSKTDGMFEDYSRKDAEELAVWNG